MTTPHLVSKANSHHSYLTFAAVLVMSIVGIEGRAERSNAQPSLASTPSATTTAQTGSGSALQWHEPRITFVDPPTLRAKETIVWAVARYRQAGLQLPDLAIHFPAFCDRKAALYHVGHGIIDFCFVGKNTVLHEFAHAWDDTSGAVDRQAFMKLRGVKVWWGGTTTPSAEQGAEQLAEIIAWGLMDPPPQCPPQCAGNAVC